MTVAEFDALKTGDKLHTVNTPWSPVEKSTEGVAAVDMSTGGNRKWVNWEDGATTPIWRDEVMTYPEYYLGFALGPKPTT